jgi:hypothetical protein
MDAGERGASGRTEERHAENGREDAVRVRWRGPEGQGAVTAEMQLLASLEVAGITAAPDVLGIEEDGYVRETAPELARRRGRRAAGAASPATGERLAQARAREDLEALVAALHERGWVLGAPRGRGLGVRADGRVVVLDLSGLRREEGLSARSADLHWIDSVLEDEERTLRRRIHALPGAGAGQAPFAAVGASLPGAPREEPGREVFAGFDGEPPAGPASSAGPASPAASASDVDPVPGPEHAPLPVPRLRRARTEGRVADEGQPSTPGEGPSRVRGAASTVASVLAQPRHRRTALLSGAVVLALGLGAGFALTLPGAPLGPSGSVAATAPADGGTDAGEGPHGTADGPSSTEAPPIEDPWALAAELAGARHAYLTGVSDLPVAADGGSAEEEDERIRAAYQGLEVRGGGPVVHEAELLRAPDAEGRAVLRVHTSNEDVEVVATTGTVERTAAGESASVELSLVWDGDRWRIQEVTAV